jgi:hypothetical protein
MWLVVTLVAALAATSAYYLLDKRHKLGFLSLMLWGTSIMVLVDHTIAFVAGEGFIEATTDGLISNSILLGLVMIAPIIMIWLASVFVSRQKSV